MEPIDGYFQPPQALGFGIVIDKNKVESEQFLSWS